MFYVLPLLADMLMGALAFLGPIWGISQGRGVEFTGTLGIVTATSYFLSCLVITRYVTQRNALQLTRFGILGIGIVIGLGAFANDARWMYPLVIGASMCASCFFTPYQVVMHSGRARPLGQTVTLYNLAWMSGYVLGPLIGSALINISRPLIHVVMLALAVIGYQLIELAVMRARAEGRDHATEKFDGADAVVQMRGRDFYIWIGWASLMAHGYAMSTVFYVFPKLGDVRGFTKPEIGRAESICTIAMLATTLLSMWLRRALYTPWLTVLAGALGACAVAILAMTHTYTANIAGLLLLGASGGINCYVSVYYVNNHINRARAIAINETAVGLAGIIAPAVGALLGGGANPTMTPYWLCAVVYIGLAVGTVWLHAARAKAELVA